MKKTLLITAALGLFITSCSKKETTEVVVTEPTVTVTDSTALDTAHNSKNSLDWSGTYEGVLPCADCEGIKNTLTISDDNNFHLTQEYINKNFSVKDSGTFTWDANGANITLNSKDNEFNYKVGENRLIQLDLEGKEIDGALKDHYILIKK